MDDENDFEEEEGEEDDDDDDDDDDESENQEQHLKRQTLLKMLENANEPFPFVQNVFVIEQGTLFCKDSQWNVLNEMMKPGKNLGMQWSQVVGILIQNIWASKNTHLHESFCNLLGAVWPLICSNQKPSDDYSQIHGNSKLQGTNQTAFHDPFITMTFSLGFLLGCLKSKDQKNPRAAGTALHKFAETMVNHPQILDVLSGMPIPISTLGENSENQNEQIVWANGLSALMTMVGLSKSVGFDPDCYTFDKVRSSTLIMSTISIMDKEYHAEDQILVQKLFVNMKGPMQSIFDQMKDLNETTMDHLEPRCMACIKSLTSIYAGLTFVMDKAKIGERKRRVFLIRLSSFHFARDSWNKIGDIASNLILGNCNISGDFVENVVKLLLGMFELLEGFIFPFKDQIIAFTVRCFQKTLEPLFFKVIYRLSTILSERVVQQSAFPQALCATWGSVMRISTSYQRKPFDLCFVAILHDRLLEPDFCSQFLHMCKMTLLMHPKLFQQQAQEFENISLFDLTFASCVQVMEYYCACAEYATLGFAFGGATDCLKVMLSSPELKAQLSLKHCQYLLYYSISILIHWTKRKRNALEGNKGLTELLFKLIHRPLLDNFDPPSNLIQVLKLQDFDFLSDQTKEQIVQLLLMPSARINRFQRSH